MSPVDTISNNGLSSLGGAGGSGGCGGSKFTRLRIRFFPVFSVGMPVCRVAWRVLGREPIYE